LFDRTGSRRYMSQELAVRPEGAKHLWRRIPPG
jgi:hypothetical protein